MGDSDPDTFANITRADYDFEDEAFEAISSAAKAFISALLLKKKEWVLFSITTFYKNIIIWT